MGSTFSAVRQRGFERSGSVVRTFLRSAVVALVCLLPMLASAQLEDDFFSTGENLQLFVAAPGVLGNDLTFGEGTPPPLSEFSVFVGESTVHGQLVLYPDGSFIYTPTHNYVGPDEFTYWVWFDEFGLAPDSATVHLEVGVVDEPPIAYPDLYTATEDTTLNVPDTNGVLVNDFDDEYDPLTAALIHDAQHGHVTMNDDGSFSYVPEPDFFGQDFFTYQAFDVFNQSLVQQVTINVQPVNDAPIAVEDLFGTPENTILSVPAPGILANDSDVDNPTLSIVLVTNPSHGQLSPVSDGGFSYEPDPDFFGTDYFYYRAFDGAAESGVTTVTILVGHKNMPPVANGDEFMAGEDTTLTISVPGVLQNDTDADNDPLTATLVEAALHGLVTLDPNGSFVYIGAPNFNGDDHFKYRITDGLSISGVAEVIIHVAPINDLPIGNPDLFVTQEGTTITVAFPGVLANDFDLDGPTLSAILQATTAHGALTLLGGGGFSYLPDPDFSGTDEFIYRVFDGLAESEDTTVTIIIGPKNSLPVANDDEFVASEDTTLTITAPGVLQNDTDADNDILTASLVVPALHGTVILNPDGSFEYCGASNFNGDDRFKYWVTDGLGRSNVAVVIIHVMGVNDPPIALPDQFGTLEDTPLTVAAPGVLANDSDPDLDPLTAVLENGPAHGVLSLNGNGSFTYTPLPDFNGDDFFTYRAFDGALTSNDVVVSITVTAVNDPPVALPEAYALDEDSSLTVSAPGVLQNDTDPDDTLLTAVLQTSPVHGTITLNPDGSFHYVPTQYYYGEDSFQYRAFDGKAWSNLTTVSLTIRKVNHPPTANNDYFSLGEDRVLTVAAPGILANDVDVDGDSLIAIIVDGPLSGTLHLNGDGSFTYNGDPHYHGVDRFRYVAYDGHTVSTTATVYLTTIFFNHKPVALDDVYNTFEDQVLTIPAANGVLKNDSDIDDDDLSAFIVHDALSGHVVLNLDGSFTYTPLPNFRGLDQFTYQAFDGLADSNIATVSINVQRVNTNPVLLNLSLNNINENDFAVLTGFVTDADPDDTLHVTVNWGDGSAPQTVDLPLGETFFTFTRQFLDDNPTATPFDIHNVRIFATDDHSGSTSATLPLVVSNVPPQLYNVVMTSPLTVGQMGTLTGGWADPGTRDTFRLFVNWGDGTPVQIVYYGMGASSFSLNHVYVIPGTFTVGVSILDDDNGNSMAFASTVVRTSSDLSIIKNASPNPANIGEDVTFNILVKNNGPDPATNVQVIDFMPTNVEVLTATLSYIEIDGLYVFNLGNMAVGQSKAFSIKVHPVQQGPIDNTAAVSSDQADANPGNNAATAELKVQPIDGADLTAEFVVVSPATCKTYAGRLYCKVTGQILITNRGNKTANASITKFYLSNDANWDKGDTALWLNRTNYILGLYTRKLNFTLNFPVNVNPSGKYIICRVDDADVVLEVNETNNRIVYGPLP